MQPDLNRKLKLEVVDGSMDPTNKSDSKGRYLRIQEVGTGRELMAESVEILSQIDKGSIIWTKTKFLCDIDLRTGRELMAESVEILSQIDKGSIIWTKTKFLCDIDLRTDIDIKAYDSIEEAADYPLLDNFGNNRGADEVFLQMKLRLLSNISTQTLLYDVTTGACLPTGDITIEISINKIVTVTACLPIAVNISYPGLFN
jgi:hypothetical protein